MSAAPANKKRERQSASQVPARHSGEGRRNPESLLSPHLPNLNGKDAASEPVVESGVVPLKCVSSKIADGSHNPPPKQASGVPMLSARNISEMGVTFDDFRFITEEAFELERKRVDLLPGDVLLTIVGSIGRTAVVPESPRQFAIQRSVAMIRPRGMDSKFCMYQLQSDRVQKWLREHARGSAQQGVYLKTLANLPMLVVPPSKQRQIVAEIEKQFTRLEAGVAALRRVQANLKRYRAAVLKAACEGRLVPTEAELARAKRRTCETGEQLLARILADRRKNWHGRGKYKEPAAPDTTNLPPLPEGWAWTRLEQLGVTYGGLTKNPKRAKLPNQLPYLRVANVYANELRLSDIEYIGVADSELEKLLVRVGDLLIVEGNGSKDQIGRLAIWKGSIDPCVHQNHLIKVRLVNPAMSKWILYWLQSTGGRHFVELVASSTSGLYTLSVNKVGDLPILLPPLTEQARIVAEVERRLSVIEGLEISVKANLRRVTRLSQAVLSRMYAENTQNSQELSK